MPPFPSKAMPLQYGGVLGVTTETPGTVVSKGTLVVCKVSLVGQWVEVRHLSDLSLELLFGGVCPGIFDDSTQQQCAQKCFSGNRNV